MVGRILGNPGLDRVHQDITFIGVVSPKDISKDIERWKEVVVAARGS